MPLEPAPSLNLADVLDTSAQRAHHLFGQVLAYLQGDNTTAAVASLRELALLRPGDTSVLYLHALVALALHKPQEAAWVLSHALKSRPNDTLLWFNLGQAHLMAKDWPQAVQSFDRLLQLQPVNAEACYRRSLAWRALGHGVRADLDLQEALRLQPGHKEALAERSRAYFTDREQCRAEHGGVTQPGALVPEPDDRSGSGNRSMAPLTGQDG